MAAARERPALLIADLHLSGDRPDGLARFLRFMSDQAKGSSGLYILGDLFEYWPGDDLLSSSAADSAAAMTVHALRTYTMSGRPLHVMHGNRDFLLGARFLSESGAVLLEDYTIVDLAGVPTLLAHGDTLCTDDIAYQEFRSEVRSAEWKRNFLARPLTQRNEIMAAYRAKSEKSKSTAPARIMDVNDAAVDEQFVRFGVRHMIHGHTHRHAHHTHQVRGNSFDRWVLPDWYVGGGFLAISDDGPQLVML